jgi:hypothetical protein
MEGTFILRFRIFDILSQVGGYPDCAIQAECYGGEFRVYSTKDFPGLPASTALTKVGAYFLIVHHVLANLSLVPAFAVHYSNSNLDVMVSESISERPSVNASPIRAKRKRQRRNQARAFRIPKTGATLTWEIDGCRGYEDKILMAVDGVF